MIEDVAVVCRPAYKQYLVHLKKARPSCLLGSAFAASKARMVSSSQLVKIMP